MKILPINLNSIKYPNIYSNTKQSSFVSQSSLQLPDYRFYQSFLGGYSLDLKQTYEKLPPEQYPEDILSMVQKEIQKPQTDKTLYDIHHKKYEGVLDCYDLFDLAEKYPEFKFVQPVDNVSALKGSFLDDFKKGQYEIFNNGEDLTLQLIKLYWGQGFSLSDLSNYIAENVMESKPVNLYYTMKKLNIPLMTQKYGNILKLSNREYNKKFTSEMSIKLKEAREAKQQYSEGEPVVIPKGELSPAHKQHISEGLKKYYQAHPEKLLSMSERQKRFYEENPEKKAELSVVMDYAWNKTQEGKSVANGLSRFLKKQYNINIKPCDISQRISSVNSCSLESFWKINSWAKDKFSQAVIKGWDYLKLNPVSSSNQPEIIESRVYPKELLKKIMAWAQKEGYTKSLKDMGKVFLFTNEPPYGKDMAEYVDFITDAYFERFPCEANDMATSIQIGLISFVNDLYYDLGKLPNNIKGDKRKIEILKRLFDDLNKETNIFNPVFQNGRMIRYPISGIESSKMFDFYCGLVELACLNNCSEIIKPLENKIDEAYFAITQSNSGCPKYLREMLYIKT